MSPGLIGRCGGSSGGGDYALLSSTTLAVAGTFDISGLSQAYSDLIVVVVGRSAAAATLVSVLTRPNNDNGAVYVGENLRATAAAITSAATGANTEADMGTIPGDTADGGYIGVVEFTIYNYTAALNKLIMSRGNAPRLGSGSYDLRLTTYQWLNAAAVNRLVIVCNSFAAGNFKAGATCRIYGRK